MVIWTMATVIWFKVESSNLDNGNEIIMNHDAYCILNARTRRQTHIHTPDRLFYVDH